MRKINLFERLWVLCVLILTEQKETWSEHLTKVKAGAEWRLGRFTRIQNHFRAWRDC